MISPANLIKRVVAGGGVVPFLKCVCVYFAVGGFGGGVSADAPSAMLVAAKCAPVVCLLIAVLFHHGASYSPQGWYARRIALGLALSAVGDALLLWPQYLLWGMCAFGAAHCAYITAFGLRPRSPLMAIACYAPAAIFVRDWLEPPASLRTAVAAYAALLATMGWRGVVQATARRASGRSGAFALFLGSLMFLLSDAILGYSLFGRPGHLPYKQLLVMSTYYAAQLGIAMSVLQTPRTISH